jgi:hypothetical protein
MSIPATNLESFKEFLGNNRRNRLILYLAAAAIVIQFAIFKYYYPFASYIYGDSYWYLDAAYLNSTVSIYPIGYSKFLRLFSVFAKPDIALVAIQYLFIQCGALFLLFTIFYFYKVGTVVQNVLLCFMVFNPLFFHLGNIVSSDGLFLSLSLVWFSLLLWIIHRPSNKIVIWHALVLFAAFTVRYNALFYPLIALLAFGLSELSLRKKIAGVGLVLLLCGWFIGITTYQFKRLTNYWQFSPFSGWQLANNAMYAYRYVSSADRKPVPKKFKALDNMIRQFFDSTHNTNRFPTEKEMASTYYMWVPQMPLTIYQERSFNKDTMATRLKKWASMGPFYKQYGLYVIKQYPSYFIRYFIWPNTQKYYAPPVEFLGAYNSGKDTVLKRAQLWFGYKSASVYSRTESNEVWILNFYPVLSGMINIAMLCCLFFYVLLKGWRQNKVFNNMIMIAGMLWLMNAGFTIFASSAALRYQSFPILITFTFAILLIDWMVSLMRNMKQAESRNKVAAFLQETIS